MLFFVIIVLAVGALRPVKIMNCAANGAGLLRQILAAFLFTCKEFQLAAGGADVNMHIQSAREKIGKVAENPTRLTKLYFFVCQKSHLRTVVRANQFFHAVFSLSNQDVESF